ncbi:MAG TPA: uroporphyrinogen decarboxylase family protein, partial [bacterium]|nr:uroporphyrinogen decarboxylase family protein [bacterium]
LTEAKMTERERMLACIELKGNGEIFSRVLITWPVWEKNAGLLERVIARCPHVKVSTGKNEQQAGTTVKDKWGCVWAYALDHLAGQVVEHPLDDWDKLKSYLAPDPEKYTDWEKEKENVREAKRKGLLAGGGVDHGFFFLLLTYLRGYENVMLDFAQEHPCLPELIEIIEDYWLKVVRKWIELGVDLVNFGDDLGLQRSLPVSPSTWRKYIKPSYQKFFRLCRENGVHAGLHTDGYVVEIIPDLLECGVSLLIPQDLVNGVDTIARLLKGKVCVDLDIDRQSLTYRGTPEEIEAHIFRCVKTLGSKQGGLFLTFGAYPGIPGENLAAVIASFEKYRNYWVKQPS